MNNTNNILLVALITATLVLGTSVIPMQSYAGGSDEHKKTKDYKSSVSANFESDKKSANQHQDQDNFCYRGDDCEQANQGQQIVGKDNEAKGFNDQSDNLAALDNGAGNGNGNGTGNGNGNGAGTTPFTPPVNNACTSPSILANVTIGSAAAVEACVNLGLITGPILPPVGGTCIAPLVAATIAVGSDVIVRACVLPGFLA
jgi:hypothetical protein